ncbi:MULTISPECIES: hypothetical protein [Yersinia]|uniref:Uncharacterized protein n=1 Tax=Yersinia kristensenii TaxID=28152 RepID=A0A0T9KYZ5_YERKR|nr:MULTISPECIES: hypothetical protein [Yersinia]MBX9498702.1 hypothetical protein [Yersinia enterocolitica]CNE43010.1 Uncharacterised protein [Yersinia kristensenii]
MSDKLVSGRTLEGYIDFYFKGNQSEFARHMDVNRQQVTKWLNDGWVVINHQLFSPKRDVPGYITGGGSAF